jgi:N-methylhydantoinase B
MTNTLNTPIEAIERDYPLRVTRYEIVERTGGRGQFNGGNGLIRALELTEGRAQVSLLAERHAVSPRGAAGGEDGARGRHRLIRSNGSQETLPAKTTLQLEPGETLEIATPGGGGLGNVPAAKR